MSAPTTSLLPHRSRDLLARTQLPWVLAAVWALLWFLAYARSGGGSWHFFSFGASVMSDLDDARSAGLHVYAEHPVLQIGPFTFLVAWLLGVVSPDHGLPGAQVVGCLLGVLVVVLVRRVGLVSIAAGRLHLDRRQLDRRLVAASVFFAPVWMYAAVSSTHLDDVLAMTLTVAALGLALADHPVAAGLAVALAIDSKPWALPMGVLLLLLPTMRSRAVALAAAGLGVAVAWLPFFLADPQTWRAVHFTIVNTRLSGLRVLSVTDPRTPPWDRPLQTLLGAGLALGAVLRGRWAGAVLLVMATRVALDPSTNNYYMAGVAVGALLWDVLGSRARWPVWTGTVLVVLFLARWAHALDFLHGWALLGFAAAATAAVLLGGPARGMEQPARVRDLQSAHDPS